MRSQCESIHTGPVDRRLQSHSSGESQQVEVPGGRDGEGARAARCASGRVSCARRNGAREPRVGRATTGRGSANPLTLERRRQRATRRWDAHLDGGSADWSASTVLDLNKISGGTNPTSCRPDVRPDRGLQRLVREHGLARHRADLGSSGSHITQATTKVNDTYFDTAPYNTPAWRGSSCARRSRTTSGSTTRTRTSTIANLGTCMDYTNDPDGGRAAQLLIRQRAPERARLRASSRRSTRTSTARRRRRQAVPPAQPSATSGVGNAPPLLAGEPRERRPSTSTHLPNGGRRVTHVFWAPLGE